MTCLYALILAASTTCHPTLDDALSAGLSAHQSGEESPVVLDVRRDREWRLTTPPEGLRELLVGERER
jgi:hypothetical protein